MFYMFPLLLKLLYVCLVFCSVVNKAKGSLGTSNDFWVSATSRMLVWGVTITVPSTLILFPRMPRTFTKWQVSICCRKSRIAYLSRQTKSRRLIYQYQSNKYMKRRLIFLHQSSIHQKGKEDQAVIRKIKYQSIEIFRERKEITRDIGYPTTWKRLHRKGK